MKYLKKFNESKESDFYNDIKDCFIEFLDREDLYLDVDDKGFIILEFYLGEEPKSLNVSELKSFYEYRLSVIKEIEVGFKRIKNMYRVNFPNTDDMLIFDFNHHNLDSMRLSQ